MRAYRSVALLAGSLAWVTAAGAEGPTEAAIAGALESFRVSWKAYVWNLDGEHDALRRGWTRTSESTDGIDSLRTAVAPEEKLVDNEQAVLESTVMGPAQVSFHWKAERGVGDELVLDIVHVVEGATGAERRIRYPEQETDWEHRSVDLPLEGTYRLRWAYVKDNFDPPQGNPGAAWLDQVVVTGRHYDEPILFRTEEAHGGETGTRLTRVSWPTIPGRVYQLVYTDAQGQVQAAMEAKTATAERMYLDEEKEFAIRRSPSYVVRFIAPPSIVSTPGRRNAEITEGDPLTLAYGAQSEGEPVTWVWTFASATDPENVTELKEGHGIEGIAVTREGMDTRLTIVAAGKAHEGRYQARVNLADAPKAQGESAPPIDVRVAEKPRLGAIVAEGSIDADGEIVRVDEDEIVRVGLGQTLCLRPESTGGTAPIKYRWSRTREQAERGVEEAEVGTTPELCLREASAGDDGRYRLEAASKKSGTARSPSIAVRVVWPAKLTHLFCQEGIRMREGDRIVLAARPEGTEPLTYQWLRNGKKVGTEQELKLWRLSTPGPGLHDEYIVKARSGYGPGAQASPVRVEVEAHEDRTLDDLGITMVAIPGGEFLMGAEGQGGAGNEGPIHNVRITGSYWMSREEISNKVWAEVTGRRAGRPEHGKRPVRVTFQEAQAFVEALNEREAARLQAEEIYRLPTEAEWEWAARWAEQWVPAQGARLRGEHEEALTGNVRDVDDGGPENAKLRWMLGNVWEWTTNRYTRRHKIEAGSGVVIDPTGPARGEQRTLRGGGVDVQPEALRLTIRHGAAPDRRGPTFGMRIVLARTGVSARYVVAQKGCAAETGEER